MALASQEAQNRRPLAVTLVFALLLSLCIVVWPATSVEAATGTYYLKGSGVPKADLSTSAPTSNSLPNYDPGSDSDPGRKLDKSDNGWNENDAGKYQLWVAPKGEMAIDGQVTLTFWSAMKDFNDDKEGRVEAFLLDCTPGGSNCALIDQGSRVSDPWSPSGSWVSNTIDFGSVSYSIADNRSLAIKVVVGDHSDDDMWFAYDTTSFPSRLSLQTVTSTTTTTTSTTTTPPTTTTSTTTTTSVPASTTATRPPAVTTTTLASSAPPSTDASNVETTTTTTTTGSGGSSTTLAGTPVQGSDPPDASGPVAEGIGVSLPEGAGTAGDPVSTGLADPALAAMGAQEALTDSSMREAAWAGHMIEGLELVIPRWAVGMVASPLLVLGFVFEAMTDSGRAIMLPLALLTAGLLWVVFENRVFTLASIRRHDDEAET